jgi:hypothetical protein
LLKDVIPLFLEMTQNSHIWGSATLEVNKGPEIRKHWPGLWSATSTSLSKATCWCIRYKLMDERGYKYMVWINFFYLQRQLRNKFICSVFFRQWTKHFHWKRKDRFIIPYVTPTVHNKCTQWLLRMGIFRFQYVEV